MVDEASIVIDVGNTFEGGVARGDTDFDDLKDYVRGITPTPGGV